jgi:hypothetical protein
MLRRSVICSKWTNTHDELNHHAEDFIWYHKWVRLYKGATESVGSRRFLVTRKRNGGAWINPYTAQKIFSDLTMVICGFAYSQRNYIKYSITEKDDNHWVKKIRILW